MAEKYEYHKQNEYPGERIAERERVESRAKEAEKKADARVAAKGRSEELKADKRVEATEKSEELKADNRVAAKGRRDDALMDSEIERSSRRAFRVNKRRDATDAIGLLVIAGLIIILLTGAILGFSAIQRQSNEIDTLNMQLDRANSDNYQLSVINQNLCGKVDTTPPTILYMAPLTSVSPFNNQMDIPVRMPITVMFSEDMNPLTINKNTFMVEQRTTPRAGSDTDEYRSLKIDGVITYSDRKATFTSNEKFHPNIIYGNVFTVTLTKDVKDTAGNPLISNYVWSFTTGDDPFRTGLTTS